MYQRSGEPVYVEMVFQICSLHRLANNEYIQHNLLKVYMTSVFNKFKDILCFNLIFENTDYC
jgi:hypothetical protein